MWFCCLFVAVLPFTVSAETGKSQHLLLPVDIDINGELHCVLEKHKLSQDRMSPKSYHFSASPNTHFYQVISIYD